MFPSLSTVRQLAGPEIECTRANVTSIAIQIPFRCLEQEHPLT
jgi:hypothetical protein